MSVKKFVIRSARKSAHLGSKVLHKGLNLTSKVEDKATKILSGTDYSIQTDEKISLEKIYYNTLPYVTPVNPSLPAIGSEPTVTLFLPTLDDKSFYGGTATALIVAGRIAELKNRKLRIVQTLKTGVAKNLSEFFEGHGVALDEDHLKVISVADRAYNIYGYVSMHPDDIFIASAWWDAHLISQLPLEKKFIYLVQDFEPIFYNNSDMYVLAEETYKGNGFIPLCNTELMYDFMKNRNYAAFTQKAASWFEPAVSRLESGVANEKSPQQKKRMFVYGRPNVHRNLFLAAMSSVDLAFKLGYLDRNEWEVFMAGQDKLPDVQLTSGVSIKNLGKMNVEDYIEFSKSIDVAVSLMMAPHPNYPTLEFASIGTSVVTTKYSNKVDLSRYSKNIIVSDIGVESIAGAIKEAAKMSYGTRIKNIETNAIPTQWANTLDKPLKELLKNI